jgi:hypothetical protein
MQGGKAGFLTCLRILPLPTASRLRGLQLFARTLSRRAHLGRRQVGRTGEFSQNNPPRSRKLGEENYIASCSPARPLAGRCLLDRHRISASKSTGYSHVRRAGQARQVLNTQRPSCTRRVTLCVREEAGVVYSSPLSFVHQPQRTCTFVTCPAWARLAC